MKHEIFSLPAFDGCVFLQIGVPVFILGAHKQGKRVVDNGRVPQKHYHKKSCHQLLNKSGIGAVHWTTVIEACPGLLCLGVVLLCIMKGIIVTSTIGSVVVYMFISHIHYHRVGLLFNDVCDVLIIDMVVVV